MGKYYPFHDWENLRNSWDNKDRINKFLEKAKFDDVIRYSALFIFIYFCLIYFFGVKLPLPPRCV
jgi:hypothetical protein